MFSPESAVPAKRRLGRPVAGWNNQKTNFCRLRFDLDQTANICMSSAKTRQGQAAHASHAYMAGMDVAPHSCSVTGDRELGDRYSTVHVLVIVTAYAFGWSCSPRSHCETSRYMLGLHTGQLTNVCQFSAFQSENFFSFRGCCPRTPAKGLCPLDPQTTSSQLAKNPGQNTVM